LSAALIVVSGSTFAVENEEGLIEEVVVIGNKRANMNAISVKKDSIRILDAVAADDISALPDFNIGEAAQRIPGVTITNDQAEARFISIRALNPSYNLMTVDGSGIAVPDRNGRRPYMDTLPSSLAGSIEVIKSLTPDLDGGAIGGIVNIVSRSAFDLDDNFFKASVTLGEYENNKGFEDDGPSGTADVVWANQFGANDDFGVVLTANYYKRDSYIPQTEYGSERFWFNDDGTRAPSYDGAFGELGEVPKERRWYWYHNDRQRIGGSAKIEYRPTDETNYWFRGFYNKATDDEARQTDLMRFGGKGTVPNQAVNPDGDITGSVLGDTRHQIYLGQFNFERSVWAAQFGHDRDIGDKKRLKIIANISGSEFDNPEYWHEWRQANTDFNYTDMGHGVYDFRPIDRAAYDDLSLYSATRQNALDTRSLDEDIYEFQVDFGSNAEGQEDGWGYKLGLKWRNTDREFDEDAQYYVPDAGNTYTMAAADVFVPNNLCPPGPGCGPNDPLFVVDPVLAFQNFEAHLAANPDQWRIDEKTTNDNRRDYGIEEDITAAYGMLTHYGDRHSLIFGVRYEDTEWKGHGRGKVNGVWVDTANSGGYSDVLPSATFNYNLSDDVVLRAAYSKAIGRVPFNALAPVNEAIVDTGAEIIVSRSNPDLKPRKADNLDFSVDYYMDNGAGLLSAGVFYKKLKDEYFQTETATTIEYGGEQIDALVTQYENVGDDINILGLELNFITNLTFLSAPWDGLGVSGNATFIDTDFEIDDGTNSIEFKEQGLLVGQSDQTYNLALFYDSAKFSGRIAYNYTGLKLSERVNFGTPWRSRYDTPKTKIDVQLAYRFTDRWTGTFNIWNLTGEGRGEVLGRRQELTIVDADFGSAYFVGVIFNN
jgi:TonB-dependent receptor